MPRIPSSGVLFGAILDGLALRAEVAHRAKVSESSLATYTAGGRILPDKLLLLQDALAHALFPSTLVATLRVPALRGGPLQQGIRGILRHWCDRWDEVAGDLGAGFPPVPPETALLAIARLVTVDVSIRASALRRARGLLGPTPATVQAFHEGRSLGAAIRRAIERLRTKRTPFALDADADGELAKSSVDNWIGGHTLPHSGNLVALSRRLADDQTPACVVELDLRLARAADDLHRQLTEAVGEELARAWAERAVLVSWRTSWLLPRDGSSADAWSRVITMPTGSAGRELVAQMARTLALPGHQRTVLAVADSWVPPVWEQFMTLASSDEELRSQFEAEGLDPGLVPHLRRMLVLPPNVAPASEVERLAESQVYGSQDDRLVAAEVAGAAIAAKDPATSIEALVAMLRARPDDLLARFQLGCAYARMGHLDAALTELQRVLDLAPDHFLAKVERGIAYLNAGKPEEGTAVIRRVLDAHPEAEPRFVGHAHHNLGVGLLRQGSFEAARDALERAVELDPTNGAAWDALGRAYLGLGDRAKARVPARRAERLGFPELLAELDRGKAS